MYLTKFFVAEKFFLAFENAFPLRFFAKSGIMQSMNTEEKFDLYYNLLTEWNKKINLTAITDYAEVKLKHFEDSILPAALIPENASVLDLGSGAGFPGIPLKIVRPDLHITLLDSLAKRVNFLNLVISELGLENIKSVHSRIEDFKERESFDVVTARAVARLNTLCEYALPFVRKGGFFLAYKSADATEEVKEAEKIISLCGGGKARVTTMPLNEQILRSFVVIEKESLCPSKFPRGQNKPRLSPIL